GTPHCCWWSTRNLTILPSTAAKRWNSGQTSSRVALRSPACWITPAAFSASARSGGKASQAWRPPALPGGGNGLAWAGGAPDRTVPAGAVCPGGGGNGLALVCPGGGGNGLDWPGAWATAADNPPTANRPANAMARTRLTR